MGSVLLLLVLLLLLLLHLLLLLLSQISCSKCTSPPSWRHVFQMHQTTLHPICTLHTIQPAHTESKHWIHFTAIHWSKNPLEHKSVGTSPLEQESIRAKIHLNKNPDIKMVFCERDFINLHFFFFTKYRFLLDAIASPSTFPCQLVSVQNTGPILQSSAKHHRWCTSGKSRSKSVRSGTYIQLPLAVLIRL